MVTQKLIFSRTREAANHPTVPKVVDERFIVGRRRVGRGNVSTSIEQRTRTERRVGRVIDDTDAALGH